WGDLPRAIYGFAGLAFAIGLLCFLVEKLDLLNRHRWIREVLTAILLFVVALPFSFRFGKGGTHWIWGELPAGVYVGSALAYGFALAWMLLDRRLRRLK